LWRFTNFAKLRETGALPMLLSMYQLQAITRVPLEKILNFLNFVMRLYLLWPLFMGGMLVAGVSTYRRWRARAMRVSPCSDGTLVLIVAILVFVTMTVLAGRQMSNSFYRFSSFIIPLVIVAGCAMWTSPRRQGGMAYRAGWLSRPMIPILVLVLCLGVTATKTRIYRNIVPIGLNALEHAAGFLSIDATYAYASSVYFFRQQARTGVSDRPAGQVFGPILKCTYPGARGAYGIVGPHTPIWSMHSGGCCMLPDCKMMSFAFFVMTPAWDRVMWGTPEEAQAALRAAGLNYFLYSHELQIRDPLPLSPLFAPDTIARHFGVRWTDGTTVLLTWPGADTIALDEAWVADYRRAVAASQFVQDFPNAAMKRLFAELRANPQAVIDSPWPQP
jgi:hypothetical protein